MHRATVAILPVLHAAKGSQNGQEHSAPTNINHAYWASYPENIQDSIDTVNWLVTTYGKHPAFVGMDMLNEPGTTNGPLPTATLQKYYTDTYNKIRTYSDCVLVHAPLLNSQQYPGAPGNWEAFMPPPQYSNVWHTWHLYYAYSGTADSALTSVNNDASNIQKWSGNYLLIGEWSLATHTAATFPQTQQLGQEELSAYGKAHAGYTFWAYKWFGNANGGGWTLNKSFQNDLVNLEDFSIKVGSQALTALALKWPSLKILSMDDDPYFSPLSAAQTPALLEIDILTDGPKWLEGFPIQCLTITDWAVQHNVDLRQDANSSAVQCDLRQEATSKVSPSLEVILRADRKIVTDQSWQRLGSLTSLELTFPSAGTAGLTNMPVYKATGLSLLPALRELGLHGDWRCLEPRAFVMPILRRLWFDEFVFQAPGPTAAQLPALSEIHLQDAKECPTWLEGFPLHCLSIDSWAQMRRTPINLLQCRVLRIAMPAGELEYNIPLYEVLELPNLRRIEIAEAKLESDGRPVAFQGTQAELDKFIARFCLRISDKAAAVVKCYSGGGHFDSEINSYDHNHQCCQICAHQF
ncbi:hypothetical protein WJX84_010965 [Apatococcus fuscideae]|uniref:glucan 1,3-beta-glucosidase n=1 Tax=Apatococcus fuscideae TaxID=2026836 RepID=A0AAW1T5Y3_9CHLO